MIKYKHNSETGIGKDYLFDEHNHQVKQTQHHVEKMHKNRKEEIITFLKTTNIRNAKDAAKALNSTLPKDKQNNSKFLVTAKQVQELRHKHVNTPVIRDLTFLYAMADYPFTCDPEENERQQYIRIVHEFPEFLLLFCSDYQSNELRGSSEEDEFFIDGTFDLCCDNVKQVVTLMRRRKYQSIAKPLIFALLQEKTENVYIHLWNCITQHAPILKKLKKIFVHCDFELSMINAIKRVVPNTQIVCCLFHLIKAVMTWIKKHFPLGHLLRDNNVQKELIIDLKKLVLEPTKRVQCRDEFNEKYRAKSKAFSTYFSETYLNGASEKHNARFPPKLWARSQIGDIPSPDMTNNQAERFNKQMNAAVVDVRTLKVAVRWFSECHVAQLKKNSDKFRTEFTSFVSCIPICLLMVAFVFPLCLALLVTVLTVQQFPPQYFPPGFRFDYFPLH